MMEAYLRERFPSVDADDVIQETLVAVWAALPSYRYAPDEKGHFHNYLTGILRNKALRQLYKEQRHAEIAEMVHDDASCDGRARTLAAPQWRRQMAWHEARIEISGCSRCDCGGRVCVAFAGRAECFRIPAERKS